MWSVLGQTKTKHLLIELFVRKSALYEKGGTSIEREFRQLLARHSVPVPPILIYDMVHEEAESPEEDKNVFEQLPGMPFAI